SRDCTRVGAGSRRPPRRAGHSLAPTSAPVLGRRKFDDAMSPEAVRGPVMVPASVLTNVHVPPRFHELLLFDEEPMDWLVPLATARLRVTVADASAMSKPVPPLRHAVL